jgi:molybdopterin-binding protein
MALSTRSRIPAEITRESADELDLEAGQQVTALIKATDVMIMTEEGVA